MTGLIQSDARTASACGLLAGFGGMTASFRELQPCCPKSSIRGPLEEVRTRLDRCPKRHGERPFCPQLSSQRDLIHPLQIKYVRVADQILDKVQEDQQRIREQNRHSGGAGRGSRGGMGNARGGGGGGFNRGESGRFPSHSHVLIDVAHDRRTESRGRRWSWGSTGSTRQGRARWWTARWSRRV